MILRRLHLLSQLITAYAGSQCSESLHTYTVQQEPSLLIYTKGAVESGLEEDFSADVWMEWDLKVSLALLIMDQSDH